MKLEEIFYEGQKGAFVLQYCRVQLFPLTYFSILLRESQRKADFLLLRHMKNL